MAVHPRLPRDRPLADPTLRGRLKVAMGQPILLLHTRGARSGQPRTSPLLYTPRGDAFVIVASKAGDAHHPAWYHNLRAHPESVTIEVNGTPHRRLAHVSPRAPSAKPVAPGQRQLQRLRHIPGRARASVSSRSSSWSQTGLEVPESQGAARRTDALAVTPHPAHAGGLRCRWVQDLKGWFCGARTALDLT